MGSANAIFFYPSRVHYVLLCNSLNGLNDRSSGKSYVHAVYIISNCLQTYPSLREAMKREILRRLPKKYQTFHNGVFVFMHQHFHFHLLTRYSFMGPFTALRRGIVPYFFVTVTVLVTVIMILAMFLFYFCLKQQEKRCIRHYDCDYDCDKKIRYKYGPLTLINAGFLVS